MKNRLLFLIMVLGASMYAESFSDLNDISVHTVMLQEEEIAEILSGEEVHVYFGPEVCPFLRDFPRIYKHMIAQNFTHEYLSIICNRIDEGKTTVAASIMEAALEEVIEYIQTFSDFLQYSEKVKYLVENIAEYCQLMEAGVLDIVIEADDTVPKFRKCKPKKYRSLKVCQLLTHCLTVNKNGKIKGNVTVDNETINGDLIVDGNETIEGNLTVSGALNVALSPFPGFIELIGAPQQACIIFVDDTFTEKARICSSPIVGDKGIFVSVDGGLTQNLRVNNAGGVTLATPSSGVALTVNGGEAIVSGDLNVSAGNIILPVATASGSQGLLELGGSGSTNVNIYEIGARNLFIGNGAVNGAVSGTDNMSIGTNANSSLTTANNTIAIGNGAQATGTDSIAIGDTAQTAFSGALVVGSADFTSTGAAPTAPNTNAIALGSANGTQSGAVASGASAIAIGGADGTFSGSVASGSHSVALGVNATAAGATSISLGSASGIPGGSAPTTAIAATGAIAIGSASGALAGSNAAGIASIAIGGSGSVFSGAQAMGSHSIALGVNATSLASSSIALGSVSDTVGDVAPITPPAATGGIAIGSANGGLSGATVSDVGAIALGGSDSIFSGAAATAARSIAIGVNSTSGSVASIALGSASGTAGGVGPLANNSNAIAIGSANATRAGAAASGISSIAIGGADTGGGSLKGPAALGDRSIALGINAASSFPTSIALGSSAAASGGAGPRANNTNSIAIGSANAGRAGAAASGLSAIAIGGADNVSTLTGSLALGDRSIALGVNASTSSALSIAFGSSAGTLGGPGAIASNTNALAIGGANGARDGALASGVSAIAIGGADTVGTLLGAIASGDHSIACGVDANASAAVSIAIGSSPGVGGSLGARASNTNALAIGSANSGSVGALSSGISAIAIGGSDGTFPGAVAAGSHSIALGVNATSAAPASIILGSASGVSGGAAPSVNASATNAVVMGSANAALAGASVGAAAGLNAIALGGSDGVFAGASARGSHSIAIGVNATASSTMSIAIGSASGTTGGSAPSASNTNAIVIGSANGTLAGAIGSGTEAISIGGSDGIFAGATAAGNHSIAIGVNANSASADSIALGSASGSPGGSAPTITGATGAIVIGSANSANPGASTTGTNSIAIGGASSTQIGALAGGNVSIALGNGASTIAANRITLGDATNTAVKLGIGTGAPAAKLHLVGANGTPVIMLNQVNAAIANAPQLLNPATLTTMGTPLHFNGSNQIFGFTSSKRYKTNIRTINDESIIIYKFKPVIYDSTEGHGEGKNIPGFIAEEVFEIAPHLTVLNKDNQPENVAYNALHALAIKEIQKHTQQLKDRDAILYHQSHIIKGLSFKMEQLQARICALEGKKT